MGTALAVGTVLAEARTALGERTTTGTATRATDSAAALADQAAAALGAARTLATGTAEATGSVHPTGTGLALAGTERPTGALGTSTTGSTTGTAGPGATSAGTTGAAQAATGTATAEAAKTTATTGHQAETTSTEAATATQPAATDAPTTETTPAATRQRVGPGGREDGRGRHTVKPGADRTDRHDRVRDRRGLDRCGGPDRVRDRARPAAPRGGGLGRRGTGTNADGRRRLRRADRLPAARRSRGRGVVHPRHRGGSDIRRRRDTGRRREDYAAVLRVINRRWRIEVVGGLDVLRAQVLHDPDRVLVRDLARRQLVVVLLDRGEPVHATRHVCPELGVRTVTEVCGKLPGAAHRAGIMDRRHGRLGLVQGVTRELHRDRGVLRMSGRVLHAGLDGRGTVGETLGRVALPVLGGLLHRLLELVGSALDLCLDAAPVVADLFDPVRIRVVDHPLERVQAVLVELSLGGSHLRRTSPAAGSWWSRCPVRDPCTTC